MSNSGGDNMIVSLIPFLLLSIPFAVGCYFLAPRLGKSRALWVILALLPVYNFFFWGYIWFAVSIRILDQLAKISARLNA